MRYVEVDSAGRSLGAITTGARDWSFWWGFFPGLKIETGGSQLRSELKETDWGTCFPPKQSLDGAPRFVVGAERKAAADPSPAKAGSG
jgi:hypothetical protein